MDYRKIPSNDKEISTIGIGGSKLHYMSVQELKDVFSTASGSGINIIDLATENREVFNRVGQALGDKRGQFMLSLHLGLTFQKDGQYKRTRNVDEVKAGFERQLAALGTDYADIGYIHYVDDFKDFENVYKSGTYDFACELKEKGIIRNLGFASHQAEIAKAFLDKGGFDLFMFSINPAYDLDPVKNNPLEKDLSSQDALQVAQERSDLYRLAQKKGVGITVMKALGAGRLLSKTASPFKKALTTTQCIQYCLDRPSVLSCMIGVSSVNDLNSLLCYYTAGKSERDYSIIADGEFKEMRGECVYCNHCLPCPSSIDIASVNKFLDLAESGDQLAGQHYLLLDHKASECIECGSCERSWPFDVTVIKKMKKAVELFGI
jgi:hypothetical protein